MCMTQTMVYFLKFLIIYLLFLNSSQATEDFDDYTSDENEIDDRDVEISPRGIITQHKHISENFIGSNLFGSGIYSKQCFSVEDVALLSTRCKFETLMPNNSISKQTLEDDKSVEVMIEYFYGLNELLNIIDKEDVKYFSQQAFHDVVGGYLNYFYWPLVKYSFYAGMLTYNSTISVYSLHKHCKDILNTIGSGWRQSKDFFRTKFKIEPISPINKNSPDAQPMITPNSKDNPCENLILVTEEDDTYRFETELIVSLPKIETDDSDGILNVRLPFKRKRSFNFNSKTSAFVLLKYYVTVTKCYEHRKEALGGFERFNWRFLKLMKEKFLPFLQRDEFYPGFGAILRILETLNRRSKVSRYAEEYSDDLFNQSGNQSESKSDDLPNTVQNETNEKGQKDMTFLEQIIHLASLEDTDMDKSKKIEIVFFTLVVIIISLALIILCCCIFIRSKKNNKKNKKNPSNESIQEEKRGCFKSFFKRCRKDKKCTENNSMTELNIGPRSSSILNGNDFDDTESRISTQTKSSGLSLKELINAEKSKRPSKPTNEQIKAFSRNSKKFTSAQISDLMEHS